MKFIKAIKNSSWRRNAVMSVSVGMFMWVTGLPVIAQDARVQVNYGQADGTSNGIQNSGNYTVSPVPGSSNASVKLWGGGGGGGGTQAKGGLINSAFQGSGGGGGGGYSAGAIGTPRYTANNVLNNTFTITVGVGGAGGEREACTGKGPCNGGNGGNTEVNYGSYVMAGGGVGSLASSNASGVLNPASDEARSGGGAGGTGTIKGTDGGTGDACNTIGTSGPCSNPYGVTTKGRAIGGSGGNGANGGGTGAAYNVALYSGTTQQYGTSGNFPGGGGSGSSSVGKSSNSANASGGKGNNGRAELYFDVFAQEAATPIIVASVAETGTNQIRMDAPYTITFSVTNPQPVAYQWYRNDTLLAGATDLSLQVTQKGKYHVTAQTYTGDYAFPQAALMSLLTTNAYVSTVTSGTNKILRISTSIGTLKPSRGVDVLDVEPLGDPVPNPLYEIWNWEDLANFAALINDPASTGLYDAKIMQDIGIPKQPATYGNGAATAKNGMVQSPYYNNTTSDSLKKYGWYGYEGHGGLEAAYNAATPQTGYGWDVVEGFFSPIGGTISVSPYMKDFKGTFNGQGFEIYGYWCENNLYNPNGWYTGLFGRATNAVIKNLGVVIHPNKSVNNHSTHPDGQTAGLVTEANNTQIDNCYVKGTVTTGILFVGGLVGLADNNTIITNCYTEGFVYNKGENYVGGLVGIAQGSTITNCYSKSGIEGLSYLGGLIGHAANENNIISDCYATGEINGTSLMGGLIGVARCNITNCYATGNVNIGYRIAGGLIGQVQGSSFQPKLQITNCYATGNVTESAPNMGLNIGGLVGQTANANFTNCYATGNVFGSGPAGGLIGSLGGKITHCFATGRVEAYNFGAAGGLVGESGGSNISNCYALNDSIHHNVLNQAQRIVGNTGVSDTLSNNYALSCMYVNGVTSYPSNHASNHGADISATTIAKNAVPFMANGWNFTNTWTFNYNNYNVTNSTNLPILQVFDKVNFPTTVQDPQTGCFNFPDTMEIWNWEDLGTFASYINNPKSNGKIKGILMQNIGIPGQTATYGNGAATAKNGMKYSPHYSDLTADSIKKYGWYGYEGHGGLEAAYNPATPQTAFNWHATEGFFPIGSQPYPFKDTFNGQGFEIYGLWIDKNIEDIGLFGVVRNNGVVKKLGIIIHPNKRVAGGNITEYTGGLVGLADPARIDSCYVKGEVGSNGGSNVGGLVGAASDALITNCYTEGEVNGNTNVGGLIGHTGTWGWILKCHSTCNVIGETTVGGLIGYGGVGFDSCYATGNVSGINNVGGLLGWQVFGGYPNMFRSYATGNVTGTGNNIGGFAGWFVDNGFQGCYATGNVLATGDNASNIGGFVGQISGDGGCWDCYATGNVTTTGNYTLQVGGFGGFFNRGHPRNCFATGNVSVSNGRETGGFVGGAGSSNITNCYATGNVTGDRLVGGFFGWLDGNLGYTVNNCYAAGKVIGDYGVGGFAGATEFSSITNCYALGDSVKGNSSFGRIVGEEYVGSTYSNNYAIECMTVNGLGLSSLFHNTKEGADVPTNDALKPNASTYTSNGWNFNTVWTFNYTVGSGAWNVDNKTNLPILQAFNNTDFPQVVQNPTAGCREEVIPDTFEIWNWEDLGIFAGFVNNPKCDGKITGIVMQNIGIPGQTATYGNGSATAQNGMKYSPYYNDVTADSLKKYGWFGYEGHGGLESAYNPLSPQTNFGWDNIEGFYPPIGNSVAVYPYNPVYKGVFEGQGFEINGLWTNHNVKNTPTYFTGLFGIMDSAVVRNLGIVIPPNKCVANMDANTQVGGLAGAARSSYITNCYVIGDTVKGIYSVGGLIGSQQKGRDSNCYTTVYVKGESTVGGLIGGETFLTLIDCHATGEVYANGSSSGGLVGSAEDGHLINSYAIGNVQGNSQVGGLVGWSSARIDTCYATGNVIAPNTGGAESIGGLIGEHCCYDVNNSYSIGNVQGYNYVGGLIGSTQSIKITNCYVTGDSVKGNNVMGGLVGRSSYVKVTNSYASIQLKGDYDVGGLMGFFTEDTIINCYATGDVNGLSDVGGLIGTAEFGKVANSYATGNVIVQNPGTGSRVGGLIGYNFATIDSCYATGNVGINWLSGSYFGGLVGNMASGYIKNSHATGNVRGRDPLGGLVGLSQCPITDCYATGNVLGALALGGLVGRATGNSYQKCDITNCYATGNVTGTAYGMGGLVGTMAPASGNVLLYIKNSYATGDVTDQEGSGYIGGLVGNMDAVTVTDCYATGNVYSYGSSGPIGGFIGFSSEKNHIYRSFATGTVGHYGYSGSYNGVGGFIGQSFRSVIANCYAFNDSVINKNTTSGTTGRFLGFSEELDTLKNNYALNCMVVNGASTGNSKDTNLGSNQILYAHHATGISSSDYIQPNSSKYTANTWDFTTTWTFNYLYGSGAYNVTSNTNLPILQVFNNTDFPLALQDPETGCTSIPDTVEIWNWEDLGRFAGYVNDPQSGGRVTGILMQDIGIPGQTATYGNGSATVKNGMRFSPHYSDLTADSIKKYGWFGYEGHGGLESAYNAAVTQTGYGWDNVTGFYPIGVNYNNFADTFNGQGFEIYGLWMDSPNLYLVGLFSSIVDDAFIENLGVVLHPTKGIKVTTNSNVMVGVLVGSTGTNTVISNCYVKGDITGTVEGQYGGLMGGMFGSAVNSYAAVNITLPKTSIGWASIGGFAGHSDGLRLTNCYATGNLTGYQYIGGFVGNASGGGIYINCYATGNIDAHRCAGGFLGAGFANMNNCYATGNVTGSSGDEWIGGFGGRISGNINNCYATGDVTAGHYVGGFIGVFDGGDINNSYTTCNIKAGNEVGGFIGYGNYGTISNSYAFNGTIDVSGSSNGRFYATKSSATFISNYALDCMEINGVRVSSSDATSKQGADISPTAIIQPNSSPYTTNGWDFSTVWTFNYTYGSGAYNVLSSTNLPILQAFNNTDFPNAVQVPKVGCLCDSVGLTVRDTTLYCNSSYSMNFTLLASTNIGNILEFSTVKDFSTVISNPNMYVVPQIGTKVYVRALDTAKGCYSEVDSIIIYSSATLLPTVSISATDTTVCTGFSTTFTATATGTGLNSVVYVWKNKGITVSSGSSATYTYVPVNGDVITCEIQTANYCSGLYITSSPITMIVKPKIIPSILIYKE